YDSGMIRSRSLYALCTNCQPCAIEGSGVIMLEKRMHPMKIFQSFIQMIKNSAIIILYLFIIKWNDDSVITFYARIGFILLVIIYLIALIINWWRLCY